MPYFSRQLAPDPSTGCLVEEGPISLILNCIFGDRREIVVTLSSGTGQAHRGRSAAAWTYTNRGTLGPEGPSF